jgi:hypothetical protein
LVLAALLAIAVLGVATAWLLLARRLPYDAPLARMYRTEADIAFLVTAVDTYFRDTGAYPPTGQEGLRLATDHLSRTANYIPHGPPADAWGNTYHYVSHEHYAEPGSGALQYADQYCAPERYQLYSPGADGDPGLGDPSKQRDNICSWDASKPWRRVYRAANKGPA